MWFLNRIAAFGAEAQAVAVCKRSLGLMIIHLDKLAGSSASFASMTYDIFTGEATTWGRRRRSWGTVITAQRKNIQTGDCILKDASVKL
jgi:hypothetical protein